MLVGEGDDQKLVIESIIERVKTKETTYVRDAATNEVKGKEDVLAFNTEQNNTGTIDGHQSGFEETLIFKCSTSSAKGRSNSFQWSLQ